MSESPGRYQRSFAGMIGAMVVLLGVVVAFVVFRDVNRTDPVSPVQPVDYAGPAAFARDEAGFALLAPDRLPPGWIATSVEFRRGNRESWHLGLLTEAKRYVALEQSPRTVAGMVEDHVGEDVTEDGTLDVGGEEWRTFTESGEDGDRALVRREAGTTTVVLGRVPQETLATLVRTLR